MKRDIPVVERGAGKLAHAATMAQIEGCVDENMPAQWLSGYALCAPGTTTTLGLTTIMAEQPMPAAQEAMLTSVALPRRTYAVASTWRVHSEHLGAQ